MMQNIKNQRALKTTTEYKAHEELYIGLLSGTSIDSIDAGLFSISKKNISTASNIKTIATVSFEIPSSLQSDLNRLITSPTIVMSEYGILNRKLGIVFADAVKELLANSNTKPEAITAIGFHGQTIYHHPDLPYNFSLQLGDPNTLRELTNIPVVTDFRQRDMINNGQGAPLAPLFHQQFFQDAHHNRAIINIGGITNITLVPSKLSVDQLDLNNQNKYIASDLGPGNTLLDQWFRLHNKTSGYSYDYDGQYAQLGEVNITLLNNLLSDQYLQKPWPKSTGREYFNLNWLSDILKNTSIVSPEDVQRTLLEFTAQIIAKNIINNNLNIEIQEAYLCGGGANNSFLTKRIVELIKPIELYNTDRLNIHADWVEAALFAWLAYCSWHKQPHNLKYITGNKKEHTQLGCVYY